MRRNAGPCHSESVGTQSIQLGLLSLIVCIWRHIVWTAPQSRTKAMTQPISLPKAISRGFAMKCPNCGKGHLFRRFLKVADACEIFGEDFTAQRADDFPAYLVIIVV